MFKLENKNRRGHNFGNRTPQTPPKTVLQHARKCKKSQLLSVVGVGSGLEVRVLRGSPLLSVSGGKTTNLTCDGFGHVTQTTFPSNNFESYACDADRFHR